MLSIRLALRRARFAIWTMSAVSVLSVLTGVLMVQLGNRWALEQGDNIFEKAQRESQTLQEHRQGNPLAAAALDAAGNAFSGLAAGLAGYFPPAGYAVAAYRGWVGGIMSVDRDAEHHSRLTRGYEAFYYLMTMLLQLIPYTLTAAAGANIGIAALASADRTGYRGPRMRMLKIPFESIRDAGWIWAISLPLFAIASVFEFVMR